MSDELKSEEEQMMEAMTAERFGMLIAKSCAEVRSSSVGFLVGQALEIDGIDTSMADYGALQKMLERIASYLDE